MCSRHTARRTTTALLAARSASGPVAIPTSACSREMRRRLRPLAASTRCTARALLVNASRATTPGTASATSPRAREVAAAPPLPPPPPPPLPHARRQRRRRHRHLPRGRAAHRVPEAHAAARGFHLPCCGSRGTTFSCRRGCLQVIGCSLPFQTSCLISHNASWGWWRVIFGSRRCSSTLALRTTPAPSAASSGGAELPLCGASHDVAAVAEAALLPTAETAQNQPAWAHAPMSAPRQRGCCGLSRGTRHATSTSYYGQRVARECLRRGWPISGRRYPWSLVTAVARWLILLPWQNQ